MECSGDFDDYREVPILASTDPEKLEQRIVELEEANEEHNRLMELLHEFRIQWIKKNPFPTPAIYEEFVTKKNNDESAFVETLELKVDANQFRRMYSKDIAYNIDAVELI
jgi:3-phenylpropionate/cinnamic acid dioxygenase small subunit